MKNYAYKLAGEVGVRFLSTLFLLVLARVVGAAEFGIYSTAFAFASVFLVLIDLGTNPIVTREIARYPEKRPQIVASVNFLKILTSCGMLALLWIGTTVVNFPPEKARLIHWLGWVMVGTAFTEYYGAIFTGLERMGTEAVLKVISKGIVMLAAFAALFLTRELFLTVKVMGLFSIVSIVVGTGLLRYHLGALGVKVDTTYLKTLLRQSMPIFGSWAFLILYDSQDILILNFYKVADQEIGLFAMAIKIIDVLKVLPVLLVSSFFPFLARQAHLSHANFSHRTKELLTYAGIGFPILTLASYLLAPQMIQALYGSSYLAAVPALRLLLIGFLIMAFNIILIQLLIALDQERQSFVGSILAFLANLGVSMILVPRFGAIGSCYAFIASELLYLGVQGYMVKKAFHRSFTQMREAPQL